MRVFISWSGKRSQIVAEGLRDWLPCVIQLVRPWMSASDLGKGARWSLEVAQELATSQLGIICLTPENLLSPWILFEAGALSKTLDQSLVCPYLFDLKPIELAGPLAQFQATSSTKDDTLKLLQNINQTLGANAMSSERIVQAFEVWWPQLEQRLERIPAAEEQLPPQRSEREVLAELLELVRAQSRVSFAIGEKGFSEAVHELVKEQLRKKIEQAVDADNSDSLQEIHESLSLSKFLLRRDLTGLLELGEYSKLSDQSIRSLIRGALDYYEPGDDTFRKVLTVALNQSTKLTSPNDSNLEE